MKQVKVILKNGGVWTSAPWRETQRKVTADTKTALQAATQGEVAQLDLECNDFTWWTFPVENIMAVGIVNCPPPTSLDQWSEE